MKKQALVILLISLSALLLARVGKAQCTVFFYCPSNGIDAGAMDLKEGSNRVGWLQGGQLIKYQTSSGEKTFTNRYGGRTVSLKQTVADKQLYFVRCYFNGNAPRLVAEHLGDAASSLPPSLVDSLVASSLTSSGARHVASIPLNSLTIRNLNPVIRNDSILLRWEEKYPLLTGEPSKPSEGRYWKNQARWVTSSGNIHQPSTTESPSTIVWGICDDGSTYTSRQEDVQEDILVNYAGPLKGDKPINILVKGKCIATWTEGNRLNMVTTEKGVKVISVTAIINGILYERKEYPLAVDVLRKNNDAVQNVQQAYDFDDPLEVVGTKLYRRPGMLYVTRDDQGNPPAHYLEAKSTISSINLETGEVRNKTFFAAGVSNLGVETSIAGDYSIWLMKNAFIKIRDLKTGEELETIALDKDLPHDNLTLRRYTILRPEIVAGPLKSSKISFVTGEPSDDGGLILRPGNYLTYQPASFISYGFGSGALLSIVSLAVKAASDSKLETRSIYLRWKPGSKIEPLREIKTINQKVDRLEMTLADLGFDMITWNYSLGNSFVYAAYQAKGEAVIRIYKVE